MKLVLLVFCGALIFIILLLILIIFSSIGLNIKECHISNFTNNIKEKKLKKEFNIYLEFYLLGIIKIAKIRLTKEILAKIKNKQDAQKIKEETKIITKSNPIKLLKNLKIKVKRFYLDLELGTEDVMITSYSVATIAAIIRHFNKKYKSSKSKISYTSNI